MSVLLPIAEARALALLACGRLQAIATAAPSRDWSAIARPEQLPPDGEWHTWLVLAGRGWGRTRTGAETIVRWVREGLATRIAILAQTAADGRDISAAAILRAAPDARYEPSKRRITFANGAVAIIFSAEDPDALRGHEFDAAWCDEVAAWRFPRSL